MKCLYCKEVAEFKCNCQKPYLCPFHLGIHLKTNKNHCYENLDIELGDLRLSRVRSKLIKSIQKINKAKIGTVSKTESLIKSIESACKQVLENLDSIKNNYIELLKRYIFCNSELSIIEKIESFDIKINNIRIDEVLSSVQSSYSQNLISYEKLLENRENLFLAHHSGGFRCGAIASDYKIMVTGGVDAAIRVWDLVQKKQKFMLLGHNSAIQCIVLTGDNQHIISGSNDASVRIWSIQQKSQSALLRGHKGGVQGISFIKNRSLIVSGDVKGEIIVWDSNTHAITKKATILSPIFVIVMDKTENSIIAGIFCGIAFIELETLNINKILQGHFDSVACLALTSDEKKLVSGSLDKSIIIWDLIQNKIISQLLGHNASVNSLALTKDDLIIVSGSDDASIHLWSMSNSRQITNFEDPKSFVNTILRGNDEFISLSADSGIGQLDIKTGVFAMKYPLKAFKFDFFDFSTDLNVIGFGSHSEAAIWDLEKEVHTSVLLGHQNDVKTVEISRDGKFALTCSSDKKANLIYWDLSKNCKLANLIGHTVTVFCATFSKDGLSAASGSGDKTVRTWNLKNYKQEYKFRGHDDSIYSIKFINNKKLLVSGGADMKLIVWNLIDKTQYNVLRGHNLAIWRVLITEDEKFIVSGDLLEGLRIWNVEKKQQELIFSFQEQASSWLKHNGIPIESVRRFLKA